MEEEVLLARSYLVINDLDKKNFRKTITVLAGWPRSRLAFRSALPHLHFVFQNRHRKHIVPTVGQCLTTTTADAYTSIHRHEERLACVRHLYSMDLRSVRFKVHEALECELRISIIREWAM